jgi:hypothetical protein
VGNRLGTQRAARVPGSALDGESLNLPLRLSSAPLGSEPLNPDLSNGSVTHFARNVRRWRDASMMLRWVGTGLHEARQQFRRLRGFRDMKRLVAALDRLNTNSGVEPRKQVA